MNKTTSFLLSFFLLACDGSTTGSSDGGTTVDLAVRSSVVLDAGGYSYTTECGRPVLRNAVWDAGYIVVGAQYNFDMGSIENSTVSCSFAFLPLTRGSKVDWTISAKADGDFGGGIWGFYDSTGYTSPSHADFRSLIANRVSVSSTGNLTVGLFFNGVTTLTRFNATAVITNF